LHKKQPDKLITPYLADQLFFKVPIQIKPEFQFFKIGDQRL